MNPEIVRCEHLVGCPVCCCAYWCECASGEDCPPECEGCTGEVAENFYAAQDRHAVYALPYKEMAAMPQADIDYLISIVRGGNSRT